MLHGFAKTRKHARPHSWHGATVASAVASTVALASGLTVAVTAQGAGASTPAGRSLESLLAAPLVRIGQPAVAPDGARSSGVMANSRVMTLGIALAPRETSALTTYATEVSTPGASQFGRFITPVEFRDTFGPTPLAVREVQEVLRAEGFSVSAPSTNGLIMDVKAPVWRIDNVFHVTMDSYRLTNGTKGWGAVGAPEMQGPIARDVTAILGLDNLVPPQNFLQRPKRAASPAAPSATSPSPRATAGSPVACKAAATGASEYGGYTFNQLAASYGIEGLYSSGDLGQGTSVDIFELEPFLTGDIDTFDKCYFGDTKAAQMMGRLHVVPVDGGIPSGPGEGEAVLDVEDVSALASDANINVYEAPSSDVGTQFATNDVYNAMVNSDNANVISASWGLCEPAFELASPGAQEVEDSIFEEAAAQGMTMYAAAGDSGSNDCAYGATATSPKVSVDDPASQPFVVGVGGTTLLAPTTPPDEKVWNEGAEGGGGGGGISRTWPSPGWQSNSGVSGVANSYSGSAAYAFCVPKASQKTSYATPPCREVPDVTIDADEYTGTSFYQKLYGGWSTIGGTSTAAPMWAGITLDVTASSDCSALADNPTNGERDLGFDSPALYEAAATTKAGTDFNDITKGNNDIFGLGKGYPATAGYDMASGLGSPVVTDGGSVSSGLAASLCSLLTPAEGQVSVTGLSPAAGPARGGNTVVVAGNGFSGAGTKVLAVTFGATPATSFTVRASGSISAVAPPEAPVPDSGNEKVETPAPVDVTVTVATAAGIRTTMPLPSLSRYVYVASNGKTLLPSVSGVGPSGGPGAGGNVVSVYGSGFGSEGPIKAVTFGGVKVTDVKYVSQYELQVTVPPRTKATQCKDGKGFVPSAVCQVEVVVTGAHGPSPALPILPGMSGRMAVNDEGIVVPASGTEIDPAPSEYDYAPKPVIASVSPNPYSESKGGALVVTGSGFSVLTLDWVNVGNASQWFNNDSEFAYISGTEIKIAVQFPTVASRTNLEGGISVRTLGGVTKSLPFSYGS
ncbi:MAG: protease pro-enzyme activation domain-containing protein [Acidimicrobiales bacterium]